MAGFSETHKLLSLAERCTLSIYYAEIISYLQLREMLQFFCSTSLCMTQRLPLLSLLSKDYANLL